MDYQTGLWEKYLVTGDWSQSKTSITYPDLLLTWNYDYPSAARTTHVLNEFSWAQDVRAIGLRLYILQTIQIHVCLFFVCLFFLSMIFAARRYSVPESSTGTITKSRLYNFELLKPNFYKVKLRVTGVYIIFLISAQNIDCGYSLEPPRRFLFLLKSIDCGYSLEQPCRCGSTEYPQSMTWEEIWKISEFFI